MKHAIELLLNPAGEVCSFSCSGKEFAAPETVSLFQVQLRDFIGNPYLLTGRDFQQINIQQQQNGYRLRFSDCPRLPGTYAEAVIRINGAESRWNITVIPGKKEYRNEWIDFPRIAFRHTDQAQWLLPVAEGTLLTSLQKRQETGFRCSYAEYALNGVSSFYPGPAAMQFEAYLAEETSLYLACHDAAHHPKAIDFLPDGGTAFHTVFQHFTGGGNTVGYDTIVRTFHGTWQDAAEIYRTWMEADDPLLPAKLRDSAAPWLMDSPVLLIYPVKGNGLDANGLEPNEYYPYSRALPMVEDYQRTFGSRMMTILMHWEGTAPWAPPYIWPPHGGEAVLKEFIDAMHRSGNLVGLYGSGIGWTQQSMIDPKYDCEEIFEKKHVKDEICLGPRGEAWSRVCNGPTGQRLGYDLCPGRDFTQNTVEHEIHAAAELGVDYLQYFDQNQGCTSPLCYAKDHGHPDLPGPWQIQAMRSLLDRAQTAAGATVIGCENAAAEPYMKVCRLNDMRSHLAWGSGGVPVPVYQYLFHEYAAGFTGNGVCLSFWIDTQKTPFFLQWLLAWNFAGGNLLAVVLKNGGKIHWNWVLPWNEPEPQQEPLKKLIRNLNTWRRGAAGKYLIAGRMAKKPEIRCATRTVFRKEGGGTEQVPVIESSAWQADNTHAVIFVNYSETPESCTVVFEQETNGIIRSGEKQTSFRAATLDVKVPPLNMVLMECKI